MKRIKILSIAVVAMGATLLISSCASSKPVAQQQPTPTKTVEDINNQIALEKQQAELDRVRAAAARDRIQDSMRMVELRNEQIQKERQTAKPVASEQRILIYCKDESFDKPGEYMAGLGIVEGRPDRTHATTDANRAAIVDIASRYIGIIKNAIEDYSKDVNVPSGKKMYESELEGGSAAIGSKVIEKYANVVCREFAKDEFNTYVGYVAVHVLLQDAKKGLADELEVRKVDYDKKKFFEKMDAELEKESEKRKAEMDAMGNE
jgi:hypothetical protein